MHISYKPLWHTLLERDMRKEDLRLAAGMTTNMIANMSKEGKHPFKTKELSHQLGIARLSFASPEDMEQYLDCTPGSSSIMGLANDTENKVQLLMDEDVKKGEYLGCHPCINTSSLKLRTADVLETFLPAVHHEPIFVQLTGE